MKLALPRPRASACSLFTTGPFRIFDHIPPGFFVLSAFSEVMISLVASSPLGSVPTLLGPVCNAGFDGFRLSSNRIFCSLGGSSTF